jgi:RNA polymerase sigma-70 factor (ECF subfamily)
MARKMLDDPDECRQSVEDAFVGAWHAAARFDPSQASARTWLVTLAYRLTMTRMRGGRLEAALESRDAPSRSPDPDQVPDQVGRVQLREAVGELSRDERELIGLAFYRGYSYQELADITGYPLDTVKAKLRLALDKLREGLQGGSDED